MFFSRFKIRQSAAYTILPTIKQTLTINCRFSCIWVYFVLQGTQKMLLNSTLDILEISENKRVSYFFFTKFWVRPWFLPHPPRMPSSASLLPSSLLFLFPLSAPPRPAPLLSFAKAPCESCEESILQQAHPINRLSGDAGGSFWCSEPQKLFASITRWPSV